MSSEQGAFEIFVRTFEGEGGPWRVSTTGGAHPVWSKTANELMYTIDDQIMMVPYRFDGRTFTANSPRPWSPVRYATGGPTRKYDLHPDGKRAIVATPDTTGTTRMTRSCSCSISSKSCDAGYRCRAQGR